MRPEGLVSNDMQKGSFCCHHRHGVLELQVTLQVIVTDTAGMRETLDPIEAEGVAVAHETAQQADVVLSVLDCATWLESHSHDADSLSSANACIDGQGFNSGVLSHPNTITVFNKADALTHQQQEQLQMQQQKQQQQQQQPYTEPRLEQQHQLLPPSEQHQLHQHTKQKQTFSQQLQESPSFVPWQRAVSHPLQTISAAVKETGQAQGPRAVLCSCKTGWNMEVLVDALEQGVQGVMQSGQEAEEALVITR